MFKGVSDILLIPPKSNIDSMGVSCGIGIFRTTLHRF